MNMSKFINELDGIGGVNINLRRNNHFNKLDVTDYEKALNVLEKAGAKPKNDLHLFYGDDYTQEFTLDTITITLWVTKEPPVKTKEEKIAELQEQINKLQNEE